MAQWFVARLSWILRTLKSGKLIWSHALVSKPIWLMWFYWQSFQMFGPYSQKMSLENVDTLILSFILFYFGVLSSASFWDIPFEYKSCTVCQWAFASHYKTGLEDNNVIHDLLTLDTLLIGIFRILQCACTCFLFQANYMESLTVHSKSQSEFLECKAMISYRCPVFFWCSFSSVCIRHPQKILKTPWGVR